MAVQQVLENLTEQRIKQQDKTNMSQMGTL